MRRRAVLGALAVLAACSREHALPDRLIAGDEDDGPLAPPRPRYPEAPDGARLAERPLTALRVAKDRAPFLRAEVDGEAVLVLVATRAAPDRFRAPVAMARLARRVALDGVPPCAARREPLAVLLAAADAEAREVLREAATFPDGRVPLAVSALPPRTKTRGTTYSEEAAAWARLAEAPAAPSGRAARAEQSFVAMLSLDYLAGNYQRRTVDEDESGALWLVDNRSAFVAHPEARALDLVLDRLKLVKRFPRGLAASLARYDEASADEDFRAGDYESWLVHRRPFRELLGRARTLRGLVASRAQ